jgi:hypothetical protein
MRISTDRESPKSRFKGKGGARLPEGETSIGRDIQESIRRSEITGIVPDGMNCNKIYAGEKGSPQQPEPEGDPRP